MSAPMKENIAMVPAKKTPNPCSVAPPSRSMTTEPMTSATDSAHMDHASADADRRFATGSTLEHLPPLSELGEECSPERLGGATTPLRARTSCSPAGAG